MAKSANRVLLSPDATSQAATEPSGVLLMGNSNTVSQETGRSKFTAWAIYRDGAKRRLLDTDDHEKSRNAAIKALEDDQVRRSRCAHND